MEFKKRGKYIYVGIKPPVGRMKWRTLKTSSMAVAKQLASDGAIKQVEYAAQINALTSEVISTLKGGARVAVKVAINTFLDNLSLRGKSAATIRSYRTQLNSWANGARASDFITRAIDATHFDKFINPEDGTKLNTLKLRRSACVSFCDYCVSAGLMFNNPADQAGIRMDLLGQREKIVDHHMPFEPEEINLLLQDTKAHPFWPAAIIIGYDYGLRLRDVCLLEIVNIKGDLLILRTSKTHSMVTLPLTGALREMLGWGVTLNNTDYLFPAQRARYLSDSGSSLSSEFAAICRRVGLKGKSFHGLRTSFIQNRNESNKLNLSSLISRLAKEQTATDAGHGSTRTTDIYLSAIPTTKQNEQTSPQSPNHGRDPRGRGQVAE